MFTEHAPLEYAVTASRGATKVHAVTWQVTHSAAEGHHTHYIPEHLPSILPADFDARQAVKD